jgi:hypothetical protein
MGGDRVLKSTFCFWPISTDFPAGFLPPVYLDQIFALRRTKRDSYQQRYV